MKSWWIMRGDGKPHDDWELPPPPSWRAFVSLRTESIRSRSWGHPGSEFRRMPQGFLIPSG